MTGLFADLSRRFSADATPDIRPRPRGRFEPDSLGDDPIGGPDNLSDDAGHPPETEGQHAPSRPEPAAPHRSPDRPAESPPSPGQSQAPVQGILPRPALDGQDRRPADATAARRHASADAPLAPPPSEPATQRPDATSGAVRIPETSVAAEARGTRSAAAESHDTDPPDADPPDADPSDADPSDADPSVHAGKPRLTTEYTEPASVFPESPDGPYPTRAPAAEAADRPPPRPEHDAPPEAPGVTIRIGRIEVRQPTPPRAEPPAPRPPRPAPVAPAATGRPAQSRLTDYLGWKR